MISSSTFSFLKSVAENNDREWFNSHKAQYEAARENVLAFTSEIIKRLAIFDSTIPGDLNPKECVMRIYRDIRFSKDKSPFKINFGIAISSNGKNFKGPGYYVHLQPGSCFVAGGSWYPEAEMLKAIRQEIDYNLSDWLSVVNNAGFIDAFGAPDQEGKLRSAPKGYSPDHPGIEYLKLKSFTAGCKVPDKDLTGPDSVLIVTELFEKLCPLMVFLRNAIA